MSCIDADGQQHLALLPSIFLMFNHRMFIYLFIHPFYAAYLRSGLGGEPRHPIPQGPFPAPPVGSRSIHQPGRKYNPSRRFWVCLGVSSQWDLPEKPPGEGTQVASKSDTEPPQLI